MTEVSAREAADPPGAPTAYSVSWNLTQRCNLRCDHCYISAGPGPRRPDELSTTECLRVMDEIAEINPNIRGMVVKAVEAHARSAGHSSVTPELMAEVRRQWGGRFAQRS